MSSNLAINIENVSKHYLMYDKPEDRLKQMILPRIQTMTGLKRSQFYKDFPAVRNVSFNVEQGQTVGIIGRNGSGKSTLLQMVCGTLTPSSGTVNVNGRIAALLELGAGFNPEFTGRENVFMNASILGLSHAEIEERLESILRFADIGIFIDQPVKTYSSGMFVRLAFAVATSVDPDILIVDEALSVGDEAFQRKCFARIEEIKSKGCTILFVSHGAQTIVQLCDRAILLDGGEMLLDGAPKIVVAQYQRLVNALPETQPDIIKEIRGLTKEDLIDNSVDVNITATVQDKAPKAKDIQLKGHRKASSIEQFDANFMSKSLVSYEQNGAEILNPRIINADGKQVNVLVRGERYTFEYTVKYEKDAHEIGFGMLIKSKSGVELSGTSSTLLTDEKFNAKAGESRRIRFGFECNFHPDTYFLNCGSGAIKNFEPVMLHRLLDAVMFRVSEEDNVPFSGFVNSHFEASIDAV